MSLKKRCEEWKALDEPHKVRMDMNIEDEIQTSLNNRDRKIMKRDATIREQAEQLQQKDALLSQREEQLRTSIMMLLSANFPVEVIAQNLNVSEEEVRRVESSR